jgi:spore coat polysaccharide biosynthesis protein SpsF (cytidylyltransferase family)
MDGIVFIARLGSTRLNKKHLIKVLDKTFLEHMITRFINSFKADIESSKVQLILATSDEPANREFEDVLRSLPIKVFYGSINNIPLRLRECAIKFDLQNVISIDGDDILCSPEATGLVREELRKTTDEKWVKTIGLPLGMNVAGYKRSVLEKSCDQIGSGKLETGWGRVFDSFESVTLKLGDYDRRSDLRFTLDYREDSEFFKRIIERFGDKIYDTSDQEVIDYVISNDLMTINKDINEKYWANFNNQMKEEG